MKVILKKFYKLELETNNLIKSIDEIKTFDNDINNLIQNRVRV